MNPKILLAEDDPLLIDIYSTKLTEKGFDVVVANSGNKVFDMLCKEKPALILLDIVLPHMYGWEVLEQIKKDPSTKDTKVIILSNLGQKEEIDKGMQLGAEKYLIKAQYTPSQVVKEVQEVLK